MGKTFVGFGFGPIQSALFLLEAYLSGNFSRFVVAEIDPQLVAAVRGNDGAYTVNIARPSRIDQVVVPGVELLNPRVEADRQAIVDAIAQADELATALPSVRFFDGGDAASVAALLAAGIAKRDPSKPAVVYAAENHNHAAEILQETVEKRLGAAAEKIQFLNTVIGKMSGVICDVSELTRLGLAPMTGDTPRAILVEEFNRILISKIQLPGFARGIEVFEEKPDLLPFEEAKLYGHNAIHALIGYLAQRKGLSTMAEAAAHPDIMAAARAAFVDESGAALQRKYAGLNEPLFTSDGWRHYVDDLLQRMVNPYLNDLVERVIRDPQRKLGYDDRIYGTMRLCLNQGVEPRELAGGAAAAVEYLAATGGHAIDEYAQVADLLGRIWGEQADQHAPRLIELTLEALKPRTARAS